MAYELKLYSVSADGGETWTEQWLTATEAKEQIIKYGFLCKQANWHSVKYIY